MKTETTDFESQTMAKHKKDTIFVINPVENYQLKLKTFFSDDFDVIKLQDGEAAIRLLKKAENADLPAAIILDWLSFIFGECEVVLDYRNSTPPLENVPIIAINHTADTMTETAENDFCATMNGQDFYTVPYVPGATQKRIAEIIKMHKDEKYLLKIKQEAKLIEKELSATPTDKLLEEAETTEMSEGAADKVTDDNESKNLKVGDIFIARAGWLGRSVQFMLIKSIDGNTINLVLLDYTQCSEPNGFDPLGWISVKPAPYDRCYSDDVISLPLSLYSPDDDTIAYRHEKIIIDIDKSEHVGNIHRDINVLRRYKACEATICDASRSYFKKGDIFYRGYGYIEFFEVVEVGKYSIKLYPIETNIIRNEANDILAFEPIPHIYREDIEFGDFSNIDASHLVKRFSAYDKENDCFPAHSNPHMTLRRYAEA